MVPNHRGRHENIQRKVVAGLIPGGILGGRKRRDACFIAEDLWSSKYPIAGL